MEHTQRQDQQDKSARTLGDVLYAGKPQTLVSEDDWAALVEATAAGDQLALHALFERSNRLVYTLIIRITNNRETSEELTLDVFHDVWRRAASYDAANGTVLGWIMNQAHSRALDRLRFEQRKKRDSSEAGDMQGIESSGPHDLHAFREQSQRVRAALTLLTLDERQAVEAAFFLELTHAEAAARLNQPLGTIKTRIRTALRKLQRVLAEELK